MKSSFGKRKLNDGNRRKAGKAISLRASIQKSRGRRHGAKQLRNILLGLSGVGLVLVLGFFLGRWALNRLLYQNPRYALTRVDVELQGRLRRDQVLRWADIPAEANVLALNLRAIQNRLESQSSVQTAEVLRELPNRLVIRVTERRPLARIVIKTLLEEQEESYYTIDEEGLVMRLRPGEDFRHLPEIRGVDSEKIVVGEKIELGEVYSALFLLSLMEQRLAQAQFHLFSIDVSKEGILEVNLEEGGKVRFSASSNQLKTQLERFEKILNYCGEVHRKLLSADLTVNRNVPVTFAPVEI
ncbi:MAG: FtsQ-type POTRA domain-containing protein [Verrucomicrobiae bacterium]|nr:FtsQ-type POTRA domain-containing protein [Verrucomicrobiae bacterium]